MWSLVYCAILFFVLTPGILLTLPKGGSKMVVAATHAVIFAAVCYFARRFVKERFQDEEEEEEKVGEGFTHACKGCNGCFPASATVTIDDGSDSGKQVTMSELQVGDKALALDASTGEVIYSDVYFFGHRGANDVDNYYTIKTESGKAIQLTKDHYMYVSENGCDDSITNATTLTPSFIKVGMGAWTYTGGEMKCSPIVSISQSEELGIYNPITLVGSIIVNDVYASSYSTSHGVPVENVLSTFMTGVEVSRATPAIWHTIVAPMRSLYNSYGVEWAANITSIYDKNHSKLNLLYRTASSIAAGGVVIPA
jgi:hypothetical protein